MLDFNLRRRTRNLVVHSRFGHSALRSLRPSEVFLTRNTVAMIEGYPRSGNSFAEAAFLYAQGNHGVALAHHSHAAGHILSGIARGLPVLLLYRDPIDAAASFMEACQGALAPDVALWEYYQFHRPLLDQTDHMTLGAFETLTRNFPSLIRRMNIRFGCSFKEFHHTPEAELEIRSIVDEISLRRSKFLTRYSSGRGVEEKATRAAVLEGYRSELRESTVLSEARAAALESYRRLQVLEAQQIRTAL